MANEIRVQSVVSITKGSQRYTNDLQSFSADMAGDRGPTPGFQLIPTGGKVISLSELADPGLCVITNLDDTNYVEYGVYDPDTDAAYTPFEIGPGRIVVLEIGRNLREQYVGTGTGTTGPGGYELFFKANTAPVGIKVEAFDR